MKKGTIKKETNSKQIKKLQIIFFILLGISLLSITIMLLVDTSTYESILESEPKVDKSIYKEWLNEEISINKIGENQKG
jgi:hypothetical protein